MKDQEQQAEVDEFYFGSCPECGDCEGPFHVRRVHWFICRTHRVRWWVGENLFRGWRFESEADWRKTAEWLEGFRIIEPDYLHVENGLEASTKES